MTGAATDKPSPLVGEGGVGGREGASQASPPATSLPTPTPAPPHKGEGNKCLALRLADGWECEKCALAWDDGDVAPACATLTYTRLALALDDEAHALEQSQRALVAGPDPIRKFRVQERLQRACEMRAAMKLVHRVAEESRAKQHKGGAG